MKKYYLFFVIFAALILFCSCAKNNAEPLSEFGISAPNPELAKNTTEIQDELVEKESEPIQQSITEKPHSEYNEKLESADIIPSSAMFVDSFYKNNLRELEDSSVIIVLGTVKSKEQMEIPELKEMGITEETTLTTIEIEKVFKGSELLDDNSSELKIEEICSIIEYEDGSKALLTTGFYYPAKEYATYLFFLKELEGGVASYTPTSRWYGKYPVTPTAVQSRKENTMTCNALELASKNAQSAAPGEIKKIFKEVCDKYYIDSTVVSILEAQE